MFRFRLLLSCLIVLFATTACSQSKPAQYLAIGNQVDFSLLEDQYGHPFKHEDVMNTVLYVNNMRGKKITRDALVGIDLSCLDAGRVVYLADISGMPSLISKLIAVPKMRDYDYPIWLDYSGLATEQLPVREDMVTLIQVSAGAIRSLEFISDSQTLQDKLLPECGEAKEQVASH